MVFEEWLEYTTVAVFPGKVQAYNTILRLHLYLKCTLVLAKFGTTENFGTKKITLRSTVCFHNFSALKSFIFFFSLSICIPFSTSGKDLTYANSICKKTCSCDSFGLSRSHYVTITFAHFIYFLVMLDSRWIEMVTHSPTRWIK